MGYILIDETTTPNGVVMVEIQFKHCLVINVRFRERQRFPHESGQPLSQCVVPAFNVRCFTTFFINALMSIAGKDLLSVFSINRGKLARAGLLTVPAVARSGDRPQLPNLLRRYKRINSASNSWVPFFIMSLLVKIVLGRMSFIYYLQVGRDRRIRPPLPTIDHCRSTRGR